jgi:hypothetical protein
MVENFVQEVFYKVFNHTLYKVFELIGVHFAQFILYGVLIL